MGVDPHGGWRQWKPSRVCFAHAPPRDTGLHIRIFGTAVAFEQDFNGRVCTSRDLDAPNPFADPLMARYARQVLEAGAGSGRLSPVDGVRNISVGAPRSAGSSALEHPCCRLRVARSTACNAKRALMCSSQE
ncbi:AraC family transcriptional regulator ligand-binding domain-containing protein [Variovorax sp. YR216]|uniref:AraC family transcriptional regulator ligand-binding domain-containing protein n=1 Tax=Variovorax sp. YR216 TaxID=1882828 RepID=UPI0035261BF1